MNLRAIIALSSAALLTLVFALVSGAGPPACPPGGDSDLDGVCNATGDDNCGNMANPGQRDNDEDGYGNMCDWDVTQDCNIGGPDLLPIFQNALQTAPWVLKKNGAFDINEDNTVGGPDLLAVFQKALGSPGPSTRSCADCAAPPGTGICP